MVGRPALTPHHGYHPRGGLRHVPGKALGPEEGAAGGGAVEDYQVAGGGGVDEVAVADGLDKAFLDGDLAAVLGVNQFDFDDVPGAAVEHGQVHPAATCGVLPQGVHTLLHEPLRIFYAWQMETTKTVPKPRKTIPKGASVLIKLDDMERERRILIPGHRFEPIRPVKCLPSGLVLLDPHARPISNRVVAVPLNQLSRYHSILDQDVMFTFFTEGSPGNLDVLTARDQGANDKLLRMSVYSLDPFFGKKGIPENIYLRVTLETLSPAVFTVTLLDPADSCLAGREAWFNELDAAFGLAMDELGYPTLNGMLLNLAYRYGGKAVYGNPAASFSEYLNSGRLLDFIDFAGGKVIWRRGTKAESLSFPEIAVKGGEGLKKPKAIRQEKPVGMTTAKKLDRFFDEYEFAFDSQEVTSFLLDMVYRERTLQEVWNRFFDAAPHWDVQPEAAEELSELITDLCDDALDGYDPVDDDFGDLRGLLVDQYADYVAWMRALEDKVESPRDLPVAEFTELARLVGHLNQLMISFNKQSHRQEASKAEIDSLRANLEQTTPIILDLERQVVDYIGKRKGAGKK